MVTYDELEWDRKLIEERVIEFHEWLLERTEQTDEGAPAAGLAVLIEDELVASSLEEVREEIAKALLADEPTLCFVLNLAGPEDHGTVVLYLLEAMNLFPNQMYTVVDGNTTFSLSVTLLCNAPFSPICYTRPRVDSPIGEAVLHDGTVVPVNFGARAID